MIGNNKNEIPEGSYQSDHISLNGSNKFYILKLSNRRRLMRNLCHEISCHQ